MKNRLLTALILCPLMASSQVSYEYITQYTIPQINDIAVQLGAPDGVININYAVDYYKLTYTTTHPNGEEITVTGGLAVPTDTECPLALASYLHGTVFEKTNVPGYMNGEGILGAVYASAGYVMAMPDYIGLGDSPGQHLYVHADSEALTSLDMLRAAEEVSGEIGFNLNDQLFLFGYSQGGHSCMALHRMIQEEFPEEYTVTHSSPMSGPYDMGGVQSDPILNNQPYSVPGYIPYLILSYQEVYGNLYIELEDAFKPAIADVIQDYIDGNISMTQVNNLMPSLPSEMFTEEYFIAVQDINHPLRQALIDNNTYGDWVPESSMSLYGCTLDEQVFYENLEIAYDDFIANGATQLQALNLGPFNHGTCANYALFFGYTEFESMRESGNMVDVNVTVVDATTGNGMDGSASVLLEDAPDSYTIEWSTGDTGETVDELSQNTYYVSIVDDNGCTVTEIFEVDEVNSITEIKAVAWKLIRDGDQLIISGCQAGESFSLFTATGKLIASKTSLSDQLSVSISGLAPGVYLVKSELSGAGSSFVR